MPRAKKDSVALNINLEMEVNEMLIRLCDEVGLTKTKLVEKAITHYVNDYDNGKLSNKRDKKKN